MKIEHAKRPDRGVTQLQYVGDDGLPASPSPAGKIVMLLGLGWVLWLALKKK